MTYTKLFNLFKPDRSDTISVDRDVSGNMQKVDDAFETVERMIAIPMNDDTAQRNIGRGDYIIRNGKIYQANSTILIGANMDTADISRVASNGLMNMNPVTSFNLYSGSSKRVQLGTSGTYIIFTSGSDSNAMTIWYVEMKTRTIIAILDNSTPVYVNQHPSYSDSLSVGSNAYPVVAEGINYIIYKINISPS